MKTTSATTSDSTRATLSAAFAATHNPATRAVAAPRPHSANRHRLLSRFVIWNALGVAGMLGVVKAGYFTLLWDADPDRLTLWSVLGIGAVFLCGLVVAGYRIMRVSQELDWVDAHPGARGASPEATKIRLFSRIAHVRDIANLLVVLGLFGTVSGFVIALSGVTPEAAGDVASIRPMVSMLISGMGVALHTTIAGLALNVWLMVNYRLLATATASLYAKLIKGSGCEA